MPIYGKDGKFQIWWTRFSAYARVFNFAQVLKEGGESSLPDKEDDVIDGSTDSGKKMTVVKKRNAIAVLNLTMAFTTDSTMALVYKAKTDGWPNGLAHKIVMALFAK